MLTIIIIIRSRPNIANKLNIITITKAVPKKIYSLISTKQIRLLRPALLYLKSESDILLIINYKFNKLLIIILVRS